MLLSGTQTLFHYLTCVSGTSPYCLTVTLAFFLLTNAWVKTLPLPHFRVAHLFYYHFLPYSPPSFGLSSFVCKGIAYHLHS